MVSLNSDGGLLIEGIALGKVFRKHKVHTTITKDQKCRSSCSTAFLGGSTRNMEYNALLMMHSPYLDLGSYIKCATKKDVHILKEYYIEKINNSTISKNHLVINGEIES